MSAPTLFSPSMEELALERCYALLRGDSVPTNPPGIQLTASQRSLLREIVSHCGAHRAISAKDLAVRCDTNDRGIRADVSEMRSRFGVRIGSSRRSEDGGYYLITSAKELFGTVGPMLNQAKSEIATARAMCSERELREIAGQTKFNLNDPLNQSVTQDAPQETHHAA